MDLVPAHRPSDLQVILRTREHAALYDPSSNSLSMQSRLPLSAQYSQSKALSRRHPSDDPSELPFYDATVETQELPGSNSVLSTDSVCPTCFRPWPIASSPRHFEADTPAFIAPNYFRLLAQATSVPGSTGNTRPSSPNIFAHDSGSSSRSYTLDIPQPLQQGTEAEGYYSRFFVEIKKLGRGARGTVFLCQHILNGNRLGKYAIKKIPVGDHAESLLKSLNEVHLMESLHHPHLIHYQHAWIESCQVSLFAPRVPTLHVLMMAANGGSLADWISARSGDAADDSPRPSNVPSHSLTARHHPKSQERNGTSSPVPGRARVEKLKAALRQRRAKRQSMPSQPAGVGVHLLREDEIYSLLHDMASGLGFLHDRGILHLDIKPGNVLLHWDDDALIPRTMLSDFGSSMLLRENWTRQRSGHTGTMEYMSPETLTTDPVTGKLKELNAKADIWSLGMILHLLLFFHLPYSQVDDVDLLRDEMLEYRGFKQSTFENLGARRRPVRLVQLLEKMLDLDPARRPSCAEILQVIDAGPEADSEPTTESLSLYRQPPFSPPARRRLSFVGASQAQQLQLPPQALPLTLALLKILSLDILRSQPSLLFRFLILSLALFGVTLPLSLRTHALLLVAHIVLCTLSS